MTETAENKLNALVARVRKVRRWLMTLAVLKVAALCLIFVSAYVGLYAWLDHRLRFGTIGRVTAFTLLVAGVAYLLYRLTKLLLGHISCSRAANYIESRKTFDQQLVTAVEFFEKKQDYPYSRALAEHLVLQVDKDTKAFEFDSTVDKWLGYAFVVIILFGLSIAGLYIQETGVYFYSYFTRLTHPLAAVEPLPPTSLESISGDIVAEPDSVVTLAARIKGRVPEFGNLVLAGAESETVDNGQDAQPEGTLQLRPSFNEEEVPKFEVTRSFSQPGQLRYRFEAGAALSPWHDITICSIPEIESITADVTLGSNRFIRPYKQEVKSNTLEVIEDSFVTLTVEATEELGNVVVTGLNGKAQTKRPEGTNKFDFKFIAEQEGFIEFALSSVQGVANENIPPLQVIIKVDERAKFKLVSPGGDYLGTNVASVPIAFEVSDDFGLTSATMCLEIAGQETRTLTIPVEEGAKSKDFTHTLELEQHDLTIGDSILFYARATDVDTGSPAASHATSSDMYFIEVRPYRQRWHQPKPMLPGGAGKQGLKSSGELLLESLLSILEYTRAILKKTWTIANKPELTEQDHSRLDSVNKDVRYCSEQLAAIRDDPRNKFDDSDKAVLNEVLRYYGSASKYLTWHKATSALTPEKHAYRVLRKFVIELEKVLCPPGSGSVPQRRDHVEMQEQVHLTRYEKERIEWELKQLAQKLAKMVAEQKLLKKTFENFLKQLTEKKKLAQKTTDEESWIAKNEKPGEGRPCPKCGGKDPNSCPACSNVTVEGALQPAPKTQAQGAGKSGAAGQGQGGGKGGAASAGERMKMLQAKQRALEEQVSQLKRALQELPETEQGGKAASRQEAEKHLDKAMAEMDKFQAKLAEAQYKADTDEAKLSEVVDELDLANRELSLAKDALESELTLNFDQMLAKYAEKLAEELADLADALDGSVKDVDREKMLARLEEAKRMLDKLSERQRRNKQDSLSEPQLSPRDGKGEAGVGTNIGDATGTGGGTFAVSYGDAGPVGNVRQLPVFAARLMARKFWSIAINAKKREAQLVEDEPSDAEYYEVESKFFEDTAKFEETHFTGSPANREAK